MNRASRKVTIELRAVGVNFGTCGVIRDARTGRKLAESDKVRPLGFGDVALRDARQIADRRGWIVDES